MMFYPMARAKFSRAHLPARQMCAQPPVLAKMVKNEIFKAFIMARSACGSARAPIKNLDSRTSIKIDVF